MAFTAEIYVFSLSSWNTTSPPKVALLANSRDTQQWKLVCKTVVYHKRMTNKRCVAFTIQQGEMFDAFTTDKAAEEEGFGGLSMCLRFRSSWFLLLDLTHFLHLGEMG